MAVSRREALAALAVLADWATTTLSADAAAQGAPTAPQAPVFARDLPNVSLDGWEVRVSHVDYAPGRVGAPHQHPGFLFAYVLQGAVVAQVIGEGVSDDVRTYRTGEMFYEPIGSTHQVSKNASATEPARLLAINLMPKGSR
jgi:quercetin dioxygenase-like cupin family protein